MSIEKEFATVALILGSDAETRGVDSFALSLIKAERQARKLVTYLVYQFPAFGPTDVTALRGALGASKHVYFEGFLTGFDALYPRPVHALVGAEYAHLRPRLTEANAYRNKIFHGQLTGRELSRQELVDLAKDINAWCTRLSAGAGGEIGYDGFGRDSFQKSAIPDLWKRYKLQLASVAAYQTFISTEMERQ